MLLGDPPLVETPHRKGVPIAMFDYLMAEEQDLIQRPKIITRDVLNVMWIYVLML